MSQNKITHLAKTEVAFDRRKICSYLTDCSKGRGGDRFFYSNPSSTKQDREIQLPKGQPGLGFSACTRHPEEGFQTNKAYFQSLKTSYDCRKVKKRNFCLSTGEESWKNLSRYEEFSVDSVYSVPLNKESNACVTLVKESKVVLSYRNNWVLFGAKY